MVLCWRDDDDGTEKSVVVMRNGFGMWGWVRTKGAESESMLLLFFSLFLFFF